MISLYYAEPGSISIRELYDRADTHARAVFDDSNKDLRSYLSFFCRVMTDVGIAEFGADPENLTFSKNEHGKEYINNRNIFFNVSHTSGLVCSAVSDSEVGVDCETLREIDWQALSERYFTRRECEAINASPEPVCEFFRIWTKKESYVKYTGEGFSRPLPSFDSSELDAIQATFRIGNTFVTVTGDVSHIRFIKEGKNK